MNPSFVIGHFYKTSIYAYSMVDMDNIIAYIESIKVINCELLGFFNRTTKTNPMETIEYLMIGITAYFIIVIYKTAMDILSFDKFRKNSGLFEYNGF